MSEKRDVEIVLQVQAGGFGADIRATCLVDQIPGLIQRLRDVGITSAQSPYLWSQPEAGEREASNGSAPTCPVHGRPMRPSQYGGFYCTAKTADGSYFSEKT